MRSGVFHIQHSGIGSEDAHRSLVICRSRTHRKPLLSRLAIQYLIPVLLTQHHHPCGAEVVAYKLHPKAPLMTMPVMGLRVSGVGTGSCERMILAGRWLSPFGQGFAPVWLL